MVFKIYFEKDEKGTCLIQEFLDWVEKNNPDLHVQIIAKLELLKNRDNHGKALTEQIADDLYALRVRYDTDIARLFWTYGKERDIWLLGGIIKKDRALPAKDLKNAIKLLKLFKERRAR